LRLKKGRTGALAAAGTRGKPLTFVWEKKEKGPEFTDACSRRGRGKKERWW